MDGDDSRVRGQEEMRGLIRDALQSTRGKLDEDTGHGTLRHCMSAVMCEVHSLSDFTQIIKKGVGGRAPGMTGLTYGLMKAWPDKVIALVYELLVKQWNSSSMPEFIKWRWMFPIPKKQGGVRMTDLRPYRWSKS